MADPQSDRVTVFEVGPRDGLQNIPYQVATDAKIEFIQALIAAGLHHIELTSFVNPAVVPAMADATAVVQGVPHQSGLHLPVLVPNERGFTRAIEAGAREIALFTSATESFCHANIHCSIDESFVRFSPVMAEAKARGMWVRGYVSVAFACPFEGPVDPEAACQVARRLLEIGCDEICFADTIGTANVTSVENFMKLAPRVIEMRQMAMHFHDTYGNAVENVAVAFDLGCRVFDGAAGGLGGCPFAPGAPGNIATEVLVDYFDSINVHTGVNSSLVHAAYTIVLAEKEKASAEVVT